MSKRAIIRGAMSLAVAAFVIIGLSGTLRAVPVFTITDLGTLGGTESRAYSVNEAGQVTGYSRLADGNRHAFLWTDTNGDGQVNGDEMQDLGTLGGNESCGYDINDSGQVAGWAGRKVGVVSHRGFLWTDLNGNGQADPGDMATLNHLGGYKSRAYGMNNAGQVAGFAMDGNDDKCTFRWTDTDGDWQDDYPNEMKNLEWLPNGDSACGYGVNTAGHVVGYSNTTGGATRAFRWIDANGNGEADPGEMENLGTLGGASQAWDINDYGEIAGYYTTLAGKDHAFAYDDIDGMVDLGTLPGGDESQAFGINYEEGLICGWSTVAGGDTHAFVYVFDDDGDDEIVDLNDLLPDGSGWVLRCARSISEHNIVGWGVIDGETHGFIMMEVVPEPATMLLVGTGLLSLVGVIRRRRLH